MLELQLTSHNSTRAKHIKTSTVPKPNRCHNKLAKTKPTSEHEIKKYSCNYTIIQN